MAKSRKWTKEENEKLIEMYDKLSDSEISEILNRSITAIQSKASKLKLKKYIESTKDDYRICKKCKRELPKTEIYFSIDKACDGGIRYVCRECGKDGRFRSEDFVFIERMTEEEELLFIERYVNYDTYDLIELFYPEFNKKKIWDTACRLRKKYNIELKRKEEVVESINKKRGIKVSELSKGRKLSKEHIEKIVKHRKEYYKTHESHWKGRVVSKEERDRLSKRNKGKWSGEKNPRHINPLNGEQNGRWKGGITPLYLELRTRIDEWKRKSMESCNYKCIISGDEFDNIHHLFPFRDIVDMVFNEINIEQREKVEDYSKEEFELIENKLLEIHYRYPLGVCLKKDIHKQFHDLYGYTKNTPEQFYEFRENYLKGMI